MPACRPPKWAVISPVDLPASQLCARDARAHASIVHVATPFAGAAHRPTPSTELVAGSEAHLQLLLTCLACDHTLVIALDTSMQPAATPAEQESDADSPDQGAQAWDRLTANKQASFLHASMLSVYQAHLRAGHSSRLSLVTCGAHQPEEASLACAAAAALSRTFFMEHRDKCGPMVDIWPPGKAPSTEVCTPAFSNSPLLFGHSSCPSHMPFTLKYNCCALLDTRCKLHITCWAGATKDT